MTGLKCLLFLNLFVNAFYDVLSILSRQCGVTQVGMYIGLDTNISKNGLNMFPEILQKSSKYLVKFPKYLHTYLCYFNVYAKICLNIVYEELHKPTCCESGFITYILVVQTC